MCLALIRHSFRIGLCHTRGGNFEEAQQDYKIIDEYIHQTELKFQLLKK